METPKTAEEVLGETYAALLGSGKNYIIEAMEAYAEQARREESLNILPIISGLYEMACMVRSNDLPDDFPFAKYLDQAEAILKATGYGKEEA